jgi:hypothetical protein
MSGGPELGDNPALRTLFFRLCSLGTWPLPPAYIYSLTCHSRVAYYTALRVRWQEAAESQGTTKCFIVASGSGIMVFGLAREQAGQVRLSSTCTTHEDNAGSLWHAVVRGAGGSGSRASLPQPGGPNRRYNHG